MGFFRGWRGLISGLLLALVLLNLLNGHTVPLPSTVSGGGFGGGGGGEERRWEEGVEPRDGSRGRRGQMLLQSVHGLAQGAISFLREAEGDVETFLNSVGGVDLWEDETLDDAGESGLQMEAESAETSESESNKVPILSATLSSSSNSTLGTAAEETGQGDKQEDVEVSTDRELSRERQHHFSSALDTGHQESNNRLKKGERGEGKEAEEGEEGKKEDRGGHVREETGKKIVDVKEESSSASVDKKGKSVGIEQSEGKRVKWVHERQRGLVGMSEMEEMADRQRSQAEQWRERMRRFREEAGGEGSRKLGSSRVGDGQAAVALARARATVAEAQVSLRERLQKRHASALADVALARERAEVMLALRQKRSGEGGGSEVQQESLRDRYEMLRAYKGAAANPIFNKAKRREECEKAVNGTRPGSPHVCTGGLVHVAMTLERHYMRGMAAAIKSLLANAACPERVTFHFPTTRADDADASQKLKKYFPSLRYEKYFIDDLNVTQHVRKMNYRGKDLENPLNYARIYLPQLLPDCVHRIIYLDTDVVVMGAIEELWEKALDGFVIGSPTFCQYKFFRYFTDDFWRNRTLSGPFVQRRTSCYFNPGVMVVDLQRWISHNITSRLEHWLEVNKATKIYSLGSLPPFLLVFAGNMKSLEKEWNVHDLGCSCNMRGQVERGKILHWSCGGKPWRRLDADSKGKAKACSFDRKYFQPYDVIGASADDPEDNLEWLPKPARKGVPSMPIKIANNKMMFMRSAAAAAAAAGGGGGGDDLHSEQIRAREAFMAQLKAHGSPKKHTFVDTAIAQTRFR